MPSDTEILAAVARALNGSIDVDESLDAVVTTVAEYLGLSTGWVWVVESDGSFRLGAARRLPDGLRGDPDWTGGSCWCQSRFCEGGLVGGGVELIKCSRLDALPTGTDGLRYHASLALEADGERLGIMNLASRDWRELSEAELRLLRAVSDMLAVALVRARLYERSTELGAVRERARLSREMHDGVAQTLTALVLRLEALRPQTTETHAVDHALALARDALNSTREAVMELRDSPFAGRLEDSVRRIVKQADERDGVTATVEITIDAEPPRRVTHAACRILQEALTNIARHAQTTACAVALEANHTSLQLAVTDRGRGFEPAEADGYGILGMRERARLVGGELDVQSDRGGTVVSLSWRGHG